MAKKDDDDAPDAASSLRQLARLVALWRASDHALGLTPAQWETLRFLAQANRFSNSPGALSKYLGATKGTISQSLSTLEKKGLIAKSSRGTDQRNVGLSLTVAGHAFLARDQRGRNAEVLQGLKPKSQRRFALVLEVLLTDVSRRVQSPSFGTCKTCGYFREGGREDAAHCMKFEVALETEEHHLLCVAHQPR